MAPAAHDAGGPATLADTPRRGRPRLSTQQRAQRRAELTDAAIDAVRSGGSDQSLDELAERLGVSKPVIYDTFGSRSGLADAIAVELANRMERTVLDQLGEPAADGTFGVTVDTVIAMIVRSLVTLVEREPEIYAFILSSMRGDRQGMLDHVLVQVVRQRIRPVIQAAAPTLSDAEQTILTDGIYGLVLAALESWQHKRATAPSRDVLVERLTALISAGLQAVEVATAQTAATTCGPAA